MPYSETVLRPHNEYHYPVTPYIKLAYADLENMNKQSNLLKVDFQKTHINMIIKRLANKTFK